MNRLWAALLIVCGTFAILGCDSGGDQEAPDTGAEMSATQKAEMEAYNKAQQDKFKTSQPDNR